MEGDDGGLDKLLEQLRLWHGGLRAEPVVFRTRKFRDSRHPPGRGLIDSAIKRD